MLIIFPILGHSALVAPAPYGPLHGHLVYSVHFDMQLLRMSLCNLTTVADELVQLDDLPCFSAHLTVGLCLGGFTMRDSQGGHAFDEVSCHGTWSCVNSCKT